jgi:hypothetical protein
MANTATEEIRKREEIPTALQVCGNCVAYEWPHDYDRHGGQCVYQYAEDNETNSQYFVPGAFHALTCGCAFFCKVRM